jgi:hypothetical protein
MTDDRSRLQFASVAVDVLAPLLKPLAYIVAEATPTLVRFESPATSLRVSHDRLSYEIDVEFVLKSDSSRVTLRDILDAADKNPTKEQNCSQASTHEGVVTALGTIASLMGRYGAPLIAGDNSAFHVIKAAAGRRDAKFTNQITQAPVRQEAERAWTLRDYHRVRELYESIENDLAPLEKNRLKYARSRN